MYLKSIEVQGFKSFANKLNFEFREGITCIVGPNGSGKSNVADAVRWVLGEQSAKQLRSGQMQDVIFSGTETRRPMGFASVSITFDNSDHVLDVDYTELTVTRRLFRSGESEYLINKAPARLKDIHEIFYDTGIGQEGYSIIGQGQIDRILSGKADERRELFDEAAGIVKFKKRKQETTRKLEGEHQNLLRVNDILSELTSRIGPLKKQSDTARVYLEKKEYLKNLDISLFLADDESAENVLREMTEKLEIAEQDMTESREAFERTKKEYDKVEGELESIEQELAGLREKASHDALVREQLKGQIELARQEISALEVSGKQYAERLETIGASYAEREEQISSARKELEEAGEEHEKAAAEEEKERALLASYDSDIAETVRGIDEAKSEVIGVLNERALVKGQGEKYGTMLEQLGIRRAGLDSRLLRLKEQEESTSREAGRNDTEILDLRGRIEKLEQNEREAEESLTALRREMGADHDRLDEMTTRYHRDSSRLESLKAMAEHYDGYGNGIRKVMETRRRNPGIRGVVADLIDVPEEYETAIETALGGSIRNIVTDNEVTAKYLIEYLKAGHFGRATFLPLTSIRGRKFDRQDALREEGVVGIAADLVSCDEEYTELKKYLLGRILVVDEIDHAIALGRKYRHSLYMVTLAGESFAPGGSITGGAFKNKDNLLGRKREIEELETGTKRLGKDVERVQASIENKKEKRNRLRESVQSFGEEIQKLRVRLGILETSKKQAEELLNTARLNAHALEKEKEDISREMESIRAKSAEASDSMETSRIREDEASKKEEELRALENDLRQKRGEQAARLEEVHVRSASLSQTQEFKRETLERLIGEMKALAEEEESIRERITSSKNESAAKENRIAQVEKTIEASLAEEEQDAARRETLQSRKEALAISHRDFFTKRDELSERISSLDREIFRLTSQKEKFETARDERTSYMFTEYNLTPSELRKMEVPNRRTDTPGLKRDISATKDAIRKLGAVNVNAIEEYKEVSERYEFLTAQHEDLVKAEETLTGIIKELEEGMRRQFSENFALIRLEFDRAFRELFGGGHGTIELDAEADILDAGISIIAHPPGKKLQNMMQLSGGEKALTAIALLFAIQNMKPSPFCLLDEIEAALDESNVGRFAAYLHKLTKNTQFIIITHRRGTMTAADRLYGITMQEKGVSTLVSVSLIEDELTG